MGYAEPNYCGSEKANDSKFTGNVDRALKTVIAKLVRQNYKSAGSTIPPFEDQGSAYASSACALTNIDDCRKCLEDLLPYVSKCSSFTTGGAQYNGQCSLSFKRLDL
ncbi:hypothetical protein LINPERHAP2_LOCUS29677 [Linum perenne]